MSRCDAIIAHLRALWIKTCQVQRIQHTRCTRRKQLKIVFTECPFKVLRFTIEPECLREKKDAIAKCNDRRVASRRRTTTLTDALFSLLQMATL